ncbi:MAG TPA: hypothetical protein VGY48_15470 [Vicinamibacterales bacterium]|jgi:hypothetical protein|nr:hypothetical protein [Vicinamibacterales bacterium]
MSRTSDTPPVRIYPETRKRLDKLIERISAIGWHSLGSNRDAAPGIANVIDEGLRLLEAKVANTKGQR